MVRSMQVDCQVMICASTGWESGVGGLDYVMLVMIKLGWLTKMQEKEYNYYIQLWLRAPGAHY